MEIPRRVLIYGYGNPGRQVDALGNEMVKKIQDWIDEHKLVCMETDSNYQLNIEDAEKISEWLKSLRMDIDTLKILPERCPYAPENGLWGDEELRQLLFQRYPSKYRVIFTLSELTVRVLHIRHGAKRYLYEE